VQVDALAGIAVAAERQIDVGILAAVGRVPGAHDQDIRGLGRAVLKTMAVVHARLEPGRVPGAQQLLAGVRDQHDFAAQHVDELVLVRMPVALARPHTRLEPQQVHAKLREPGRLAQGLPAAAPAGFVVGRRIARPGFHRHFGAVDLRHGGPLKNL
jgi:hypothetical protein